MLGKLPPCPGKVNKAVKDHLSSGQTVEREQTQSLLSSDKHQVILLMSHLCSFQLGKSLPPRADKHSRTGVNLSLRFLFSSPQGPKSTILKIAGKAR